MSRETGKYSIRDTNRQLCDSPCLWIRVHHAMKERGKSEKFLWIFILKFIFKHFHGRWSELMCVRRWTVSVLFCLNGRRQISHLYGLSPVCLSLWAFSTCRRRKRTNRIISCIQTLHHPRSPYYGQTSLCTNHICTVWCRYAIDYVRPNGSAFDSSYRTIHTRTVSLRCAFDNVWPIRRSLQTFCRNHYKRTFWRRRAVSDDSAKWFAFWTLCHICHIETVCLANEWSNDFANHRHVQMICHKSHTRIFECSRAFSDATSTKFGIWTFSGIFRIGIASHRCVSNDGVAMHANYWIVYCIRCKLLAFGRHGFVDGQSIGRHFGIAGHIPDSRKFLWMIRGWIRRLVARFRRQRVVKHLLWFVQCDSVRFVLSKLSPIVRTAAGMIARKNISVHIRRRCSAVSHPMRKPKMELFSDLIQWWDEDVEFTNL